MPRASGRGSGEFAASNSEPDHAEELRGPDGTSELGLGAHPAGPVEAAGALNALLVLADRSRAHHQSTSSV